MNSVIELLSTPLQYLRIILDIIVDCIFTLIYYKSGKNQLNSPNDEILNRSVIDLSDLIKKRQFKCEDVVNMYINRLKQVNHICNAVTDTRFMQAISEAKHFDVLMEKNDPSVHNMPLLGIPFTTKESTSVTGMRHTFGLCVRKNVMATDDAHVIQKLKSAGAIIIAVTNVPEINLWQETRNMLFGQTLNPYDVTRTVGGSSGGEACLVAACGTAFGIGSDIGGSIRMPAFFCGVFGHKPTTGSVPMYGFTLRDGKNDDNTMVTAGPLCRSPKDLKLILKVILNSNTIRAKLDSFVDFKNLNCYYISEINHPLVSPLSGEMQVSFNRILHFLSDSCTNAPVELRIADIKYAYSLWKYWMSKESPSFRSVLTAENGKVNLFWEVLKKFRGISNLTLAAIIKLIDEKLPLPDESWAIEMTDKLIREFMKYLGDNSILIIPSYTWPASYHYTAFFRPFNFVYWALFNVLKFPVTQVPLGLSKDGLPIGVQIVAAPGNDHLCIAAAIEINEHLDTYVPPFLVRVPKLVSDCS